MKTDRSQPTSRLFTATLALAVLAMLSQLTSADAALIAQTWRAATPPQPAVLCLLGATLLGLRIYLGRRMRKSQND